MTHDTEQSFYDQLAGEYDAMTEFDRRLEHARSFTGRILERHRCRNALDAACGTGLFTIPLAQNVTSVTGADIAPSMVEVARKNAAGRGLHNIEWTVAPMQNLRRELDAKYDLILCLGNSLPHLLTDDDLEATLRGFRELLAADGMLALHLLNYQRVLDKQERVVSINRAGESEFVRFYDFDMDGVIRFNILRIAWQADGTCTHRMQSVLLRPYTYQELEGDLQRFGFTGIKPYGDLAFRPFMPTDSPVLLLTAKASES